MIIIFLFVNNNKKISQYISLCKQIPTFIFIEGVLMKFTEQEWNTLKTYISINQESTIHNLKAAIICFDTTYQCNIFKVLFKKIKKLNEYEYTKLYNDIMKD